MGYIYIPLFTTPKVLKRNDYSFMHIHIVVVSYICSHNYLGKD